MRMSVWGVTVYDEQTPAQRGYDGLLGVKAELSATHHDITWHRHSERQHVALLDRLVLP